MTTQPPGEPGTGRGRKRIDRQRALTISAVGLSAALVLVSSLLVWKPATAAPRLNIGTDPEGYVLEGLAEPGTTIELGSSGPARIGGVAESGENLADVIVNGGGRSTHATIDRSVDPPVWWVYAAPPEPGHTVFTVESVGTDGSSRIEEVEYTFVAPEPSDVVLSPELVRLGSEDGPELRSMDDGTGVATIIGADPGVVHVGSILTAPPQRDTLPTGLLRRVTGTRGDDNLLLAQTVPVALDDVLLQGTVVPIDDPDSAQDGSTPVEDDRGGDATEADAFSFAVSNSLGLADADTADLIDGLGPCEDCTHTEPIRASGDTRTIDAEGESDADSNARSTDASWRLEAGLRAEATLDVTLQIEWSWSWFEPVGSVSTHTTSVEIDAAVAARIGASSSGEDPATGDRFAVSGVDPGLLVAGTAVDAEAGGLPVVLQPSLRLGLAWDGHLTGGSELAVAGSFNGVGSLGFDGSEPAAKGSTTTGGDLRWTAGGTGEITISPVISLSLHLADGYGMTADIRSEMQAELPEPSTGSPASLEMTTTTGIGPAPQGPWLSQLRKYTPLGDEESFNEDFTGTEKASENPTGEWSESRERIAAPPAPKRAPGEPLSVMLLVDTSGSMSEQDPNGVIKLAGAKTALRDFLSSVASSARIGLRTFPDMATSGCNAGSVVFPIGEHDRTDIQSAIGALEANGDTPTAVALEAAFTEDLPPTGKRTVVLISDGESTCGGDPCEVARSFAGQGVEVETPTVNGIGFQISDTGADELQCISDVTNGRYTTVDDVEALNEELRQLAGPVLAVQIDDIPNASLDAAGTPEEPMVVTARVKNAGGKAANDVLVTLRSDVSSVSIPDAGRQIGVVAPGEEREVHWVVVPGATGSVDLEVEASLIGDISGEAGATDSATAEIDQAAGDERGNSPLNGESTVALLGDGWTSGVGAGAYQNGTDVAGEPGGSNYCRRSELTFGSPVEDDGPGPFGRRVNLACGSATTADLLNASSSEMEPDGEGILPAQVRQLEQADGAFDAVFMTAGAVDEQLGSWLRGCRTGRCDRMPLPEKDRDPSALTTSLVATYRAVDQTLNSDSALDTRNGATAPIIVPAYPLLFPLSAEAQQRCDLPLDLVRAANNEVISLNNDVQRATRISRGRGLPVYFVGETQAAFQGDTAWGEPSHTICDGAPYVHGPGEADALYPTAEGYRSLTRRLSRALEVRGSDWFSAVGNASGNNDSVGQSGAAEPETQWASIEEPVVVTTRSVRDLPSGGSVRAGSAVKVTGSGYEPGSVVVARLGNGGPVLGSARADPDGSVEIAANAPTWLRPGEETLNLIGADPEGQLLINQQGLVIDPPRTWVWPATAAVSLLVAGACAVLLVRRFQQRSSRAPATAADQPTPQMAG